MQLSVKVLSSVFSHEKTKNRALCIHRGILGRVIGVGFQCRALGMRDECGMTGDRKWRWHKKTGIGPSQRGHRRNSPGGHWGRTARALGDTGVTAQV